MRTRHFASSVTYSHSNLLQSQLWEGLICASVPSLVKFKRVNKSLPPEQPSSSPFHVHICSLYVQKSTEARPDSVGIGLAEELEAFQLLASVVPLPRAAGSQLMAMLGTQRERTVADFPIAIAPIPAHHQLQMSHQQLETFRLMLRFSESLGQMFLTFCVLSHNSTLSSLSFDLGVFPPRLLILFPASPKQDYNWKSMFEIFIATSHNYARHRSPASGNFSLTSYDYINTCFYYFSVFHSYDQHMVHLDLARIMHLIIAATLGLTPRHLHNTEGGCYSLISILLL